MALMEEVLGTALSQAQGYFGIQTLYPAIQEFAELNTNIKMVNAQLGQTFKITSPLNKSITNLAASAGLSSTKLLGAASAASVYHKTLSEDLMKSTVMFADATGLSSESIGDFVGKMLSIGAVSEKSYEKMLEGILQVRDTYGLTSEAMDDVLRLTHRYALVTGETGTKIESTASNIAEFTSRLKAAGVETSEITGLIEKMIDPDKMEDNLMLLSKMGMSIQDLTVGDPLKDLESMTPKLKSLAEEILAQPNRMIANEMAKMYGYTLEDMRKFSKIDTSDRAIEERKQLEKYREEIMTATSSLKDLGSHVFGTVAEFLNSTIMPIFDGLGPKTSGVLSAGFAILMAKIAKRFLSIKKGILETGRKVGNIYRASLISGAEDASKILRSGLSFDKKRLDEIKKIKVGLEVDDLKDNDYLNKTPDKNKYSYQEDNFSEIIINEVEKIFNSIREEVINLSNEINNFKTPKTGIEIDDKKSNKKSAKVDGKRKKASLVTGTEDDTIVEKNTNKKKKVNKKTGLDFNEIEMPKEIDKFEENRKKVVANSIKSTEETVREYNKSLYDAIVESEERLNKHSRDIEKFKNSPNDARKYYQNNINLINELNKEDLNWFERKSVQQRAKKYNKPIKYKKDSALESQYALVKERTAEMYEKYLERDTNIQKLRGDVSKLGELKNSGELSSFQEKELARMSSTLTTLESQNNNLFQKIRGTKSGMELLSSFYEKDLQDLNSLNNRKAELENKKFEAEKKLSEANENKNIEDARIIEKTINNLEEGIKQIENLTNSLENRTKMAELEGVNGGKSISNLTTEEINSIKESAKLRAGVELKEYKKIRKSEIKIENKKARREAFGLAPGASTLQLGGAYVKTAAKAGLDNVGGAVKNMGKSILGGIKGMFNPAMLAMMGGTMLVGALMKNEAFQKTITKTIGSLVKLVSPLVDFIASFLAKPLNLINKGLDRILKAPIFKEKEPENKENIVEDLRRYEDANKIRYNGDKIEIILQKMVDKQEEANGYAKGTKNGIDFIGYTSRGNVRE